MTEEQNKGKLVAYNLQQLDCSKNDCTKWAVVAVIDPLGDLFTYCREHGQVGAERHLIPEGWGVAR